MTGSVAMVRTGARALAGTLTWSAWSALRGAATVLAAQPPDGPWQHALADAGVTVLRCPPGPWPSVASHLLDEAGAGRPVAWFASPDGDPGLGEALTRELVRRSTSGLRVPQVEVVLGSWDAPGSGLLELVQVMDRLRSPAGCPWDAEQTHESLLPYALEEAYELVEAVELGDRAHLVEELGDLLLQVVFHARMAQEHPDSPFDVDDVAGGIVTKLRRRHPHVFGAADAPTAAHVEASWDRIKAEEKGRASVLDGVPVAMPALARAHKLLGRVERAGLDVPLPDGAGHGDRILREVAATRAAGLEAEQETRAALRRYEDRARAAEGGAPAPPARLRSIAPGMDPAVVAAVDERLAGVVVEHGVAVPLAVESGSLAWGFPSPDPAYDCRIVYVRPAADYLSPWPHPDVIETPLDAVLDVGGWDLRKTLRLLVEGNATVLEWLRSPIAYDVDPVFRDTLLALADEVVGRDALRRHHLHVGRGHRDSLGDRREVPLERVFHALRPALTLRWLREHPGAVVPPMDLPTLLAQVDVPADVRAAVDEAVARRAVTRELGTGAVPPVLLALIDDELGRDDDLLGAPPDPDPAHARARATEVFGLVVARWAPPG